MAAAEGREEVRTGLLPGAREPGHHQRHPFSCGGVGARLDATDLRLRCATGPRDLPCAAASPRLATQVKVWMDSGARKLKQSHRVSAEI